ncbi:hypothetical protein ACMUMQ_01445 [Marinomonas sp. 2405UD66-6]|uniref:hypothetical protein n=1 Tax=Marinomonas sp. 2405UD66-6 TaxID=3391834 RepID=UPI0039C965CB
MSVSPSNSFLSSFINNQKGWVSLPIIALLLAISSLSTHFQNTMIASYQWRGQLTDLEEDQQIWRDFIDNYVTSPSFHLAMLSDCVGFCDLAEQQASDEESTWSKDGQILRYQWSRYDLSEDKDKDKDKDEDEDEEEESEGETTSVIQTSYRLCATQNQQAYLCWWWRDGKLLSSGWVAVN